MKPNATPNCSSGAATATPDDVIRALRNVGLRVRIASQSLPGTFVPGVWCDEGEVVTVPDVVFVGDLLHEAAHLAVTPSRFRSYWTPTTDLNDPNDPLLQAITAYTRGAGALEVESPTWRGILQMGEGEALAWEYALLTKEGFDPVPFFSHPERFDGKGLEILDALQASQHFGVNGLQAAGFTTVRTYPQMKKWLQA